MSFWRANFSLVDGKRVITITWFLKEVNFFRLMTSLDKLSSLKKFKLEIPVLQSISRAIQSTDKGRCDSFDRFNEPQLLRQDRFHNSLEDKPYLRRLYGRAQRLWNSFRCTIWVTMLISIWILSFCFLKTSLENSEKHPIKPMGQILSLSHLDLIHMGCYAQIYKERTSDWHWYAPLCRKRHLR